jgi:hypothetical protein
MSSSLAKTALSLKTNPHLQHTYPKAEKVDQGVFTKTAEEKALLKQLKKAHKQK